VKFRAAAESKRSLSDDVRCATDALGHERVIAHGVTRLARALADRSWHRATRHLLTLPQLDVGYRLIVAELA
jgi:hypothetical protein